jgi:ELWxxDGT repeat protein
VTRRPLVLVAPLLLAGSLAGTARAQAPLAVPRLVADIRPLPHPPASGDPRALTAGRDLLFFAADDEFSGAELWATDGAPAGARRVADICPGPCPSSPQG